MLDSLFESMVYLVALTQRRPVHRVRGQMRGKHALNPARKRAECFYGCDPHNQPPFL